MVQKDKARELMLPSLILQRERVLIPGTELPQSHLTVMHWSMAHLREFQGYCHAEPTSAPLNAPHGEMALCSQEGMKTGKK